MEQLLELRPKTLLPLVVEEVQEKEGQEKEDNRVLAIKVVAHLQLAGASKYFRSNGL